MNTVTINIDGSTSVQSFRVLLLSEGINRIDIAGLSPEQEVLVDFDDLIPELDVIQVDENGQRKAITYKRNQNPNEVISIYCECKYFAVGKPPLRQIEATLILKFPN